MSGVTSICCISVLVMATLAVGLNGHNDQSKSSLESPVYNTAGFEDPKVYWFRPARNFLSVVANNDQFSVYFAEYLNGKITFWDAIEKSDSKAAVIALPLFGLSLALATMIVGIVYCSCSCCCGRCGSKRMQSEKHAHNKCRRITLMVFMGFFLSIILVGIIYTFAANPVIDKPLKTARTALLDGIEDVIIYANYTTFEFTTYWMDESLYLDNLESVANGLKTQLEEAVATGYGERSINAALVVERSLNYMHIEMETFLFSLETLRGNLSSATIKDKVDKFNIAIDDINIVIRDQCPDPSLNISTGVTVDVMDGAVQSIDEAIIDVANAQTFNLTAMAEFIEDRVNPDGTYNIIDMDDKFDALTMTISNYSDVMEDAFMSIEETLKKMLSQAQEANHTLHNTVLEGFIDNIMVYTRLPLSLVTLLIFLLFLTGFLGGALLFRSRTLTTERSSASNFFGNMILKCVILSLVFSVPFWACVSVLYIPGCMAEVFCRPFFSDSSNFTALDNVIAASGLDFGDIFGANSNVNISTILVSCLANMPVYKALLLEGQVHLEDALLNQTVNDQFAKLLQDLEVNESDLHILPPDLNDALIAYVSASVVNLDELQAALKNPVEPATYEDWLALVKNDTCNSNGNLTASVKDFYDNAASAFQKDVVEILSDALEKVLHNSRRLQLSIGIVMANSLIVSSGDAAAYDKYSQTLTESSSHFMSYLTTFQNDTYWKLTSELGQCLPLWNSYHFSRLKLCRVFVEEYNGYWFNMGVCLFFLIGACVTGVMLSKYFLKMKKLDPKHNDDTKYYSKHANAGESEYSSKSNLQHYHNEKFGIISPALLDETPVKIPRLVGTKNPPQPTNVITWRINTNQRYDSFRQPLSATSKEEYYY